MKKLLSILIIGALLFVFSNASFAQGNEDYTYYYNLGYAKLVDGDFKEAVDIFNKTLSFKPDCAEALLGLGIAYRQLKDLNKALEATEKALKFDPKYYKAYYNLALIYEQQGNKKDAFEAYKIFYKKVPEAKNIPDLKEKIDQLKKEI